MKIGPLEIPPKKEQNTEEEISNKEEQFVDNVIDKVSKFDTDGYQDYDKENFNLFLKENNIDLSNILDTYLNKTDPQRRFSVREMKYTMAFRSWLNCDTKNAQEYLRKKFDFRCDSNEEFLNKYRFFNLVAFFAYQVEDPFIKKEISENENAIFSILKEEKLKERGSFLLNYLAEDWVSVYERKIDGLFSEKQHDWVPYKITPNVYAFDTEHSVFIALNKPNLDLEKTSLYISKEEDYKKITSIIEKLEANLSIKRDFNIDEIQRDLDINKESFKELEKYFFLLKPEALMMDKESNNLNSVDMYLFRELKIGYHRDNLKEKTGIDFLELSLVEQRYFIDYLKFVDIGFVKNIVDFNKKFGKDGFRTFLSIEQGGEKMGDKILKLGDSEKLPEDVADKVFKKYGEIINTVDNIEEEIRKIFGNKDISNKVLVSVKETLLKRGAKMLSDLGDKVLDPKFKVNEVEILKELDEIKEETIILGQSYVGLYKEGIKVPIEDITTIKETSTKDLTEERKEELVKIYEKGRPKVTYDKQDHLEFLKEEFRNELNDKDISVVEICFKEETIIIALLDKKDEETLHIGGFTFIEDVKNAVIAEATMSYAFDKFKNYNIKALVDSRNPLLNMYLKRFGFRITKKLDSPEEIKNNGGEIYYEVEKTKDLKIGVKVEEKEGLKEAA